MGRALESKIQSSSDGATTSGSACCDTDALLHEAAVCWQEAVTLNPLHVEALFARGYALHQVLAYTADYHILISTAQCSCSVLRVTIIGAAVLILLV
jgi:hypothetical protein